MPTDAQPSPLAAAALALVGDRVTASELVARLAASDAVVTEAAAEARLDELRRLGLTRRVGIREELLGRLPRPRHGGCASSTRTG